LCLSIFLYLNRPLFAFPFFCCPTSYSLSFPAVSAIHFTVLLPRLHHLSRGQLKTTPPVSRVSTCLPLFVSTMCPPCVCKYRPNSQCFNCVGELWKCIMLRYSVAGPQGRNFHLCQLKCWRNVTKAHGSGTGCTGCKGNCFPIVLRS